jgi:ABC-2 type transport system permease protein
MSEMMVIVRRELLERVRARSFLVGTLLFPLLLVALMVLPHVLGSRGTRRTLAVVNEGPATVADAFVAALADTVGLDTDNRYRIERVEGSLSDVRERLNARVTAKEIDGYVAFPADVLERNEVIYRARSVAGLSVMRDLRRAASRAVQAERLQRAGLNGAAVASLVRPVDLAAARLTTRGEEGGDALSSFFTAYIVAFLIYFLTLFYGMSITRSVIEEKTNRIAEVMVSSVRPGHLMAGKILGVAGAILLQLAIWAAIIVVLTTQSELLAQRFGFGPNALKGLAIDPWVGVALFLFFVLGFVLYAALFAALGAAVTSDQEAQSLQMVLMIPLIAPLVAIEPVTTDPLGATATALGLIPFTSPITTPMRMAVSPVPIGQILGSLALLLAGIVVVAWLAGRIYRIGILSTGKRPTLSELGRWLRMA